MSAESILSALKITMWRYLMAHRPILNDKQRNTLFSIPTREHELLQYYENEEDRTMFIIGGGEIYKEALKKDIVDEMYITKVNKSFNADTFFPEINLREWRRSKILTNPQDVKHEAEFDIWKYESQVEF